jgi:predicted NBD/HSP70 family sugar kinase
MELLFDVGGTNIRVGVSEDGDTLTKNHIFSTPDTFEESLDLMLKEAEKLSSEKPEVVILGVGAPITPDGTGLAHKGPMKGKIRIDNWYEKAVKQAFEEKFNAPVHLANDAVLAGLGEAGYGAGRGHSIMGYLTFSTGVGGSKIVDGKVDPVVSGFEPAFMITDLDPDRREFGQKREIGGGFLDGWRLQEKYGKPLEEITDPEAWKDIAYLMAVVVNNCTLLWSPEVMIIGGGLTKSVDLDILKSFTEDAMRAFTIVPEIKLAELGDFGGLYGALQLAKTIKQNSR